MAKVSKRDGALAFRKAFPQAQSLWEVTIPRVGRLEAWHLGKTIVLVQDYATGDGWQAYTPTTDEGEIDKTLDAIAARAGVNRG